MRSNQVVDAIFGAFLGAWLGGIGIWTAPWYAVVGFIPLLMWLGLCLSLLPEKSTKRGVMIYNVIIIALVAVLFGAVFDVLSTAISITFFSTVLFCWTAAVLLRESEAIRGLLGIISK